MSITSIGQPPTRQTVERNSAQSASFPGFDATEAQRHRHVRTVCSWDILPVHVPIRRGGFSEQRKRIELVRQEDCREPNIACAETHARTAAAVNPQPAC